MITYENKMQNASGIVLSAQEYLELEKISLDSKVFLSNKENFVREKEAIKKINSETFDRLAQPFLKDYFSIWSGKPLTVDQQNKLYSKHSSFADFIVKAFTSDKGIDINGADMFLKRLCAQVQWKFVKN